LVSTHFHGGCEIRSCVRDWYDDGDASPDSAQVNDQRVVVLESSLMAFVTVLYVADICGRPGRQATAHLVKPLREKYGVDYVIANSENAAGGFGITPEMAKKMFAYGVDLQTSGNHIWDRYDIVRYLYQKPKLLRPANFPEEAPGQGWYLEDVGGVKIGVINLQGRTYMKDIDCPFKVGKHLVYRLREQTKVIFVDFHAEATSEKQAMWHYLDGMVSAVIGSHTHVQTADETISPNGTAYLTDAGMTGPFDSVIGMQKEPSIERFVTGMPKRFTTATDDVKLSGVVLRISAESGRTESIERIRYDFDLDTFKPEDIVPAVSETENEADESYDESYDESQSDNEEELQG
jgi:2',3'-cyclic-nucleotide 2'-phosphodiesterase